MNKSLLLAILLVVLSSFKTGDVIIWKYDNAHAKLGFSISHLMLTDVEGSFKNVDATITSSNDEFTNAVVEMTAQVNSIDTDNEQRDTHLKSPDFFDAEKHPTITFKSTSFKKQRMQMSMRLQETLPCTVQPNPLR